MSTLKKSNFLAAVTTEPMTRAQLVDALEEFTFIASFLDYLTEHFIEQGKITKNEDGTIQRIAKKSGQPREVYAVLYNTEKEEYFMESRTLEAGETDWKEKGWATTQKRAVKNAVSAAHKEYTKNCTLIKAVLVEEEADDAAEAA